MLPAPHLHYSSPDSLQLCRPDLYIPLCCCQKLTLETTKENEAVDICLGRRQAELTL
jgi:hypothetical protein